MKLFALIAFAVSLVPSLGHAWGPEGHNVIANVAYQRLSPDLRAKFDAIMAGGRGLQVTYTDDRGREHNCGARTINQLANWPDCVRYGGKYADTYGAHFNDIPYCPKPPKANTPASACAGGVCATKFLPLKIAELKAAETRPFERAAALAFVVHIVGDMHQPLHMIDNHDKGGNGIHATFEGRKINLHQIWDGTVVTEAYDTIAEAMNGTMDLATRHEPDWSRGHPGQADFDSWAAASHRLAVDAYNAVKPALSCEGPDNLDHEIGQDYLNRFVPSVKAQLAKGAVRLSDILKDALGAAR